MFCQNCGNEVESTTSFCPKCGNSLSGTGPMQIRTSSVQQRQQIRQDELNEIDRMINYFSKKQDKYNEYDSVCERLDPNYLRKRPSLIIWGLVSIATGILLITGGGFLWSIPLILGGGALIFAFVKSTQARNNNYAEASKRYYELAEELYNYYCDYGPCLVSASYSNPSNLSAIRQMIQSGRADTIGDALNTLLDDEHKAAMEAYSQRTAASAEEAAHSAGIAANNTRVAAVFSAANFFYNVQRDRQ